MKPFEKAQWIWAEDNTKSNDWVRFYKTFEVEDQKKKLRLKIACDTKYYLWLNGVLKVFDGGLFRESSPGNGYYDEVELGNLAKGANVLEFRVWYYGNGGRNNTSSGAAGLIFESENSVIFSDAQTLAARDTAHYTSAVENPAYLYGGHNICYDARKEMIGLSQYKPAACYGAYPCKPWNICEKRPVPLIRFGQIIKPDYERAEELIKIKLPYAMQLTPYIKVTAKGGEKIDIRTDRYKVNGGPGDHNAYSGHRTEYICKAGEQSFESLNWVFGETLLFTIPQSVEVNAIGYRESSYETNLKKFSFEDKRLTALVEKCGRTLVCCMRDNFMDCPDRERGQWIGDVSVQAPQVFYALDNNAVLLLKKALIDFFRLKKENRLVGNVPGDNFCELPSQSLNAISEIGMLAEYYAHTGDKKILKLALLPCVKYLKLFKMTKDGLVAPRKGDWEWYDHLYNIDAPVLANAWYYSAVRYAIFMCKELGSFVHLEFFEKREKSIKDNFHKKFWNGSFYASGAFADDRANAMAVLSGLYQADTAPKLREVLVSVANSTPYMEYYVLEALCRMGLKEDAYNRMMSRYNVFIEKPESTIGEDFAILGTKNHAWSGGPLTIICTHFPELIKASE